MTICITAQQWNVLAELFTDGASNETIARRLGLSVWTVRSHMKQVTAQCGMDRTELCVAFLRGWLWFACRVHNSHTCRDHK